MINSSRLEHIMASGRGNSYKGTHIVMFTLYIDDSGTSPTDQVAVAAAWIARRIA